MLHLRKFLSVPFVAISVFSFLATAAADERLLAQDFDARGLEVSEKRFLQAALAFQGYYTGLLDGKWGRSSQSSLERYAYDRFSSEPRMVHAATLAFDFVDLQETEGWQIRNFPKYQTSFAFPGKVVSLFEEQDNFLHWKHNEAQFEILISSFDFGGMARLHQSTLEAAIPNSEPYVLRKDDLWVSSTQKYGNLSIYMRSHKVGDAWVVIYLEGDTGQRAILNGVASSISVGIGDRLSIPENGMLNELIVATLEWLDDDDQDEVESDVAYDQTPVAGTLLGSGSAFFVSSSALLTNAHVVRDCGSVRMDGEVVSVTAISDEFDLAALSVDATASARGIASFAATPPELNSDITVVGFPLSGLLGGLNVTRGSVAGLKGLAGDYSTIQISAPVQSGNSGGPVINASGNIVGVVVSKLDAKRFADAVGEIPQNINFAVRGEIAKLFLSANQISFRQETDNLTISPVDLAKRAVKYTVQLECYS